MGLSDSQCRNRWKKRTYDCTLDEYFRRAPDKLKARVKQFIVRSGYINPDSYLPATIYECYKVNMSNRLCNELIEHYLKNTEK